MGSLSSETSAGAERLIEDDVIVADLPCVRCTYNLRGLSPKSRCPECGQEILLSVYGPIRVGQLGGGLAWLGHVARGCRVVAVAYFAFLPFALFGACTLGQPTAGLVVGCLWSCLYVLGCWWATCPRQGAGAGRAETAVRLAARWCAVAALGCVASVPVGGLASALWFYPLGMGAPVCLLAAHGLLWAYLYRLAALMSDARLRSVSAHLIWLLPVPLVVSVVGSGALGSWYGVLSVVIVLSLMAVIVPVLLCVTTLLEFAERFGTAARLAGSRRQEAGEGTG